MGSYKIICSKCSKQYRYQGRTDYDAMSWTRTEARYSGWDVGLEILCPRCKKEQDAA